MIIENLLLNTSSSLKKCFLHYSTSLASCVPKYLPVQDSDIEYLIQFIKSTSSLVVLTGAGISTESGIPDYRSEEVGLYARTNHKPIQHHEFVKHPKVQQRFWARNYVGWDAFSQKQPNPVHYSLKDLEVKHHKILSIVTQNVDNLHYKAGSQKVVELHGSAYNVFCLKCKATYNRHDVQKKLQELNPFMTHTYEMIRPDGDVAIPEDKVLNFHPPTCDSCNGVLKPSITFFGDNVPIERVNIVKQLVTASDGLLVLGSSLSVFSGYRIVLQAVEEKKKVIIVNIGPTRADKIVDYKISAKCGDILPKIVNSLN